MKALFHCSTLCVTLLLGFSVWADTHYVSVNSTNPVPPFTNWTTAANVIQDAVDVATTNDTVLVTNGVYDTGGKAIHGTMTNRVAVDKPLTLMSVNGPEFTTIQGYQVPGTTNGDNAIRCVYLTNAATLSGFTLTEGATRSSGSVTHALSGGGLWCESLNAWTSNCTLVGNSAYYEAGGSYRGTFSSCMFISNSAQFGGGASLSMLTNCTLSANSAGGGGGAYRGTLINCQLIGNSASTGGGCYSGTLYGCTVISNAATFAGGGTAGGTLIDCALTANSADDYGGGSYSGSLYDCTLTSNAVTSFGGGASHAALSNCRLTGNSARRGGGSYRCTLEDCRLEENLANEGGGSYESILVDCILKSNVAGLRGGGALLDVLRNCTLVRNSAWVGGGSYNSTLNNSILYFNEAVSGSSTSNYYDGILQHCCTAPLPTNGIGNITNAPLFVDTNNWVDLRLQSNSPCINAGNNAYVTTTNDLDGNPRIVGGTVDMGAYEFQNPQSFISYAYLQHYGLPTDGSADNMDGDNDKATTWQEWKMWTIPTNQLSVLRMLHPDPQTNGIAVSWQSVSGHSYTLQRSTNSATDFTVLQSDIAGQAGTAIFTDTTATNGDAFFYRVSVPE